MKKVIKLTESDLTRIVKRILNEQPTADRQAELSAMKEIQSKIEELIDFAEGKCMEIYNNESMCENFIKIISNQSLTDLHTDYENIFMNNEKSN
jgi:hypothetical protein